MWEIFSFHLLFVRRHFHSITFIWLSILADKTKYQNLQSYLEVHIMVLPCTNISNCQYFPLQSYYRLIKHRINENYASWSKYFQVARSSNWNDQFGEENLSVNAIVIVMTNSFNTYFHIIIETFTTLKLWTQTNIWKSVNWCRCS